MVMVSIHNAIRVFPLPLTPLNQVIATEKQNKATDIMCSVGMQSLSKDWFALPSDKPMTHSGKMLFSKIKGSEASIDIMVMRFSNGITALVRPSPIANETSVLVAELKPQNGTI